MLFSWHRRVMVADLPLGPPPLKGVQGLDPVVCGILTGPGFEDMQAIG